jgi:deoxyribodipyrimidine photolyase-related protein
MEYVTLRLIMGDQLNLKHSWFTQKDPSVLYLMAEMRQETDYVKHHIQKVTGFFLAMRDFAQELQNQGLHVHYIPITDERATYSLPEILKQCIATFSIQHFEYQLPDEYRLDVQLRTFCKSLSITHQVVDTEHFYTTREELGQFFEGKKQFLMENFYRMMRKKYQVLMVGNDPLGNQWNFDHDNRLKYKNQVPVPPMAVFPKNVRGVLDEIYQAGVQTFGEIEPHFFTWPINRKEALEQLDYFCDHLLPHFGDYEDAMHTEQAFLFHSRLSFVMNTKIVSPKEVVDRVVQHYYSHQETITLSQVEGFVRQVIGWREYIRGIYWRHMPDYAQRNALDNTYPLPEMYWTGKTKMNCMQHALGLSLQNAYAHHIQRLMVIGNFSLLTQRHPDAVDAWYLGVYMDALEWVELPNTRGMSQYADGGILATKPYVSSGSYIQKMSNYCTGCHYDVKSRTGQQSCPFNSLYWNFLDDKKAYFAKNQRMAMMLNLLGKIQPEELYAIKKRASEIIENPDLF